jgi:hypothetical protein
MGGHKDRVKEGKYGTLIYENTTVKTVEIVQRRGRANKGEKWGESN